MSKLSLIKSQKINLEALTLVAVHSWCALSSIQLHPILRLEAPHAHKRRTLEERLENERLVLYQRALQILGCYNT